MCCRAAVASLADAEEEVQQPVLAMGPVLRLVQLQSHQRCQASIVVRLLAMKMALVVGLNAGTHSATDYT